MEIIEWIIYLIYFIGFNIGWIIGCRVAATKGGITHATVATTMLMTLISVIFLFADYNKLHLIWITPILILTSSLNMVLFSVPLIGNVYFILTKLFYSVIIIGIKMNNIKQN